MKARGSLWLGAKLDNQKKYGTIQKSKRDWLKKINARNANENQH